MDEEGELIPVNKRKKIPLAEQPGALPAVRWTKDRPRPVSQAPILHECVYLTHITLLGRDAEHLGERRR